MKVAPCGSDKTVIRTHGASNGATSTLPAELHRLVCDLVGAVDHERHAPVGRDAMLQRLDARDDVLEARGAHLRGALSVARLMLLEMVTIGRQRPSLEVVATASTRHPNTDP